MNTQAPPDTTGGAYLTALSLTSNDVIPLTPNVAQHFLALGDRYLHANRELRLLVETPTAVPVFARLQLRARVRLNGIMGLIPLVAKEGGIGGTHRLDLQ